MTKHDVNEIFDYLDENNDGCITLDEFMTMIKSNEDISPTKSVIDMKELNKAIEVI